MITPNDRAVLQLLARGYTREAIAKRLDMSLEGMKNRLAAARKRTGDTPNAAAAVAAGMAQDVRTCLDARDLAAAYRVLDMWVPGSGRDRAVNR